LALEKLYYMISLSLNKNRIPQ